MVFEFQRFRFHFAAKDSIVFPPGMAGNTIRGAFGRILRGVTDEATYAHIFEPHGEGPSGLADRPRPFVFRAANLDGSTLPDGARFHFDVHSFDLKNPPAVHFARAFAELAREGIGPRRGRAELTAVEQLNQEGQPVEEPVRLNLSPDRVAVPRLLVRFETPTELKSGGVTERPDFAVLFGRARDRLSTLRALYGAGALDIDFRAMGERAAEVRLTRWDWRREAVERTSSRTRQTHSIGGFLGEAEYEGDLAEFAPFLRAARWTGVGRQTVWGKGVIEVE